MNAENLKSDLKQVFDNDLALRKEFNELKRSLSDYRNQLIERDEDCKRLQVTIDVLNTKMAVMERDNQNYKAELAAFKELRASIKEQLQAKQDEITNYLGEIESLKSQLDNIGVEYEARIESVKNASYEELDAVKKELGTQIEELRSNAHYREIGIRDEYEIKINSLSQLLQEKEVEMNSRHESEMSNLRDEYFKQIETIKSNYEAKLTEGSSVSESKIESITNEYEGKLKRAEDTFNELFNESTSAFESRINDLETALEIQKTELNSSHTSTIENLTSEFQNREQELINGYENRISELTNSSSSEIETLKGEYESRISNTLIHSNEQNSKLNEELNKFILENEHFKEKIREMLLHMDEQNTRIEDLGREIEIKNGEIGNQTDKFNELTSEFENYKQLQLQSQSEQVQLLNSELSKVCETVSSLESELESKNNTIAELHSSVSSKAAELGYTKSEVERLTNELNRNLSEWDEKESSFESFKQELEIITQQQLQNKDIEFQKLLNENTSLIEEIDAAQDKIEALESEMSLIKAELVESNSSVDARVNELKEVLNAKNYELTNLSGNNAALQSELNALKNSNEELSKQLELAKTSELENSNWENKYSALVSENGTLSGTIESMKQETESLRSEIETLNSKIGTYEVQIADLKNSSSKNQEQEEYIDRLFKQIDSLNDERLNLLNEKEQMAEQLLKMNDVVGGISQHIDSQSIDVNDLNNHRKNIILAKSSSGLNNDNNAMKKQINELVREIDKCIALLSA